MTNRNFFLTVMMLMGLMCMAAWAQDPCAPPPGAYCTATQGGWGQDNCNGNNVACFRNANFATAFLGGLTVGGNFTIHLSTSAAIAAFLPSNGGPNPLTSNHVNPATTEAGTLAGQTISLALAVGFGDAGTWTDIGGLYYFGAGPFFALTIDEILAIANQVLGGNLAALPAGANVSALNTVLANINGNFDFCGVAGTWIVEPGCTLLAIELSSFSAIAGAHDIRIEWSTASETDNDHFNLYRANNSGTYQRIAQIDGAGSSSTSRSYSFSDENVVHDITYTYQLEAIDLNGDARLVGQTVNASINGGAVAEIYELEQNYPNPFNPSTTIGFTIPVESAVRLTVFDPIGREIALVVNETLTADHYTVTFDGSDLATGLYFYRLDAGEFTSIRKFVLVK